MIKTQSGITFFNWKDTLLFFALLKLYLHFELWQFCFNGTKTCHLNAHNENHLHLLVMVNTTNI